MTLQAHTMAPMNLFCSRFLKSLLIREDSASKPPESQSDDDDDEQMHSDDDWTTDNTYSKTKTMIATEYMDTKLHLL